MYIKYLWVILLMEEILHQLRLVVYPIIYRVLAPSQVVIARFQPSTVFHDFQNRQPKFSGKILELPRWSLPWKNFWPLMGWSLARVTLLAIEKDGAIYETRGVFYSALYTDEYDVIMIINVMWSLMWCDHDVIIWPFFNSTCFSSVTGPLKEIVF